MVKILEESFDGCYKLASRKRRGGEKYREEENYVFPTKSFQYYLECWKFLLEFFSLMTLSQKFKYKKSVLILSCYCERHEGKVKIYFHLFLTSTLEGDERSASCLRLL